MVVKIRSAKSVERCVAQNVVKDANAKVRSANANNIGLDKLNPDGIKN